MIPVEKPMPAAMALASCRIKSANRTPAAVVRTESSDKIKTAVDV
jgi:hypothetical protein